MTISFHQRSVVLTEGRNPFPRMRGEEKPPRRILKLLLLGLLLIVVFSALMLWGLVLYGERILNEQTSKPGSQA